MNITVIDNQEIIGKHNGHTAQTVINAIMAAKLVGEENQPIYLIVDGVMFPFDAYHLFKLADYLLDNLLISNAEWEKLNHFINGCVV